MIIKVMAKKFTKNGRGNYGTRVCFAYHDESFEGFPVSSIWIPIQFAKPENIVIGQIYKIKIHDSYVVKLIPITTGKEVI